MGSTEEYFLTLGNGLLRVCEKGAVLGLLSLAGERAMALSQGQKRGDQRGGL